jgi:hypothetical protein
MGQCAGLTLILEKQYSFERYAMCDVQWNLDLFIIWTHLNP